jgi:hypothetical protein
MQNNFLLEFGQSEDLFYRQKRKFYLQIRKYLQNLQAVFISDILSRGGGGYRNFLGGMS